MTLDEGHYYIYFFVAIAFGKVSLWLCKSLENSGNFFLLLCGHLPGLRASLCLVLSVYHAVMISQQHCCGSTAYRPDAIPVTQPTP